jgi:hypothetical protein
MGKAFSHSIEYLLMWIPHGLKPGGAFLKGKQLFLYHKFPSRSSSILESPLLNLRRIKEVFLWTARKK